MLIEVVTLDKRELESIIERATKHAIIAVRNELQKPTPEIMKKVELARYLRCDVSKINRYMKEGLPYTLFGAHPRFRKSEIDHWLDNVCSKEIQGQAA